MLYTKILNKLDDEPKGFSDKLAKIAGYATGSALRKTLKEHREFGKTSGLIKIVQTLFPQEEQQIIGNQALTFDPNNKASRHMLEYCEMNELHDVKRKLISKMKSCSNSTSKEWAKVYEIDDKFMNEEMTFLQAVREYVSLNPKSPEMQCICEIFRAFCYLKEQDYKVVFQLVESIAPKIELIADEYMHDMIYGRYLLCMAQCYIRNNNKEEARLYCNKLINDIQDKSLSTYGYLHLGNSLILESYDKAHEVLLKGYKLSENCAPRVRLNIKRSLNFLDNLYKKDPKMLDLESKDPSDVHELIFYYINYKQYTKATELLDDEIKNVKMTDNQLAFHWHLRGLITGKMEDFCNALEYFKKSGDLYFKEITIVELKKLNVQDCILKLIAV
jgi:tetratricopeptide (TPR) repeat protein